MITGRPLWQDTRQGQRGITLLELMIVVVIVGILAAIAYPSYQEQVAKARRADAQTALMELAQFMERHYTANASYLDGTDPPDLPFEESPKDAGAKFYDLSLQSTTATTFVLEADPKNAQAGDRCGWMRLSNTGVKSAEGGVNDCWRR